jgi:hypothetical protein
MNTKNVCFSFIILSLLLAACSAGPNGFLLPSTAGQGQIRETEQARETPLPPQPVVSSFDEFVAGLEAAGADVEVVGDFDQPLPFIEVTAHIVRVNGADVQVLEFEDESSRRAAEALLQDRTSSIQDVLPEWITQANIWSNGNLIALYVGEDAETIRLITSLLGAPLVIANDEAQVSQVAMEVARRALQALGPELQRVSFLSIERTEWPDSCLGIAQGDEACAQVVTPGFLIIVEIDGQRFAFHTDETGQNIRLEQ